MRSRWGGALLTGHLLTIKSEEMQRTKNILTAELIAFVLASLCLVVLFETELFVPGAYDKEHSSCFLVVTIMELVSLCFIPLALYLFKFRRVHEALTSDGANSAKNLLFWGSMRIVMLCVPMLLNTLFYYIFGIVVSFGYMAIILLLCLFMVYPSMGRCISETTNDVEK